MPGEMSTISFIDQPDVIKKSFNTLVYGKSPTRSRDPTIKEITFDPSYGSVNSPSRGRSRDSLSQRLIRLRWKLI
jgi:hypothetical protein